MERATYWIWGAIGAVLGSSAAAYVAGPAQAKQREDWVEVADAAQLVPGVPEQLVFRRVRRDGWKTATEKVAAWLVKTPREGVVAFAPQCTHLGCAYRWDAAQGNFKCPCHASSFGLDGRVLSGPAPRPLDRYEVRVQNSKVWLGPRKGAAV